MFTRLRSRHGVLCSCESTRNEGGTGSSCAETSLAVTATAPKKRKVATAKGRLALLNEDGCHRAQVGIGCVALAVSLLARRATSAGE